MLHGHCRSAAPDRIIPCKILHGRHGLRVLPAEGEKTADLLDGLRVKLVLHHAGILLGNGMRHMYQFEECPERFVPVLDNLRNLPPLRCQGADDS